MTPQVRGLRRPSRVGTLLHVQQTDAPLASANARRERDAIVDLCARAENGDFLAEVSSRLSAIVPFDASFWAAIDPLTSLATSPARVENFQGDEQCAAYWEREFLAEDFLRFSDIAVAARPVATLYDATNGKPRRSGRHILLNESLGLDDELRAACRVGRTPWGVLALYRQQGQPTFSAAEQKVVADLSGSIGEAFRRNALVPPSFVAKGGPEAPGLLTFDGRGVLESMNDAAEAWLHEIPRSPLGSGLPGLNATTEVLSVVHRARAIAAGLESGVARVRLMGVSGRWIVVHASCMRAADGSADRVAVVIEAAKGSEMAPIIVEAYGLTQREREITEALARGAGTAEIARSLYLSPHTVRDYLKAIFERVSVSSRGELVAKLFAEHYMPDLVERIDEVDL